MGKQDSMTATYTYDPHLKTPRWSYLSKVWANILQCASSQPPQCPPGHTFTNGVCNAESGPVCPPGTKLDVGGVCISQTVPSCTTGQFDGSVCKATSPPVCPPGDYYNSYPSNSYLTFCKGPISMVKSVRLPINQRAPRVRKSQLILQQVKQSVALLEWP